MSDAEVRPNQQAETVPDFPRNDLGEIIIDQPLDLGGGIEFEVGITVGELAIKVVEYAREAQEESEYLLVEADVYSAARRIQIEGTGAEGLDPLIRKKAEEVIHYTRNSLRKLDTTDEEILPELTGKLNDINSRISEVISDADKITGLFIEIFPTEILQSALELGFETDIESPLSWSPENWQQVASMTPEEQEYFAGKKKQSNSAKRVWARRANEMLHDTMLEQAIIDTERLGGNPKNVNLKTPNYNYQEWQIIKPLAEQADRANSMLYASMLEEARIEAEAQGKNAGDVRVEKPNYTYEEWKAMEVIHAAIKERQSDAAKRGWATRMNAKLPSGEEYTYKQWKDIEAFVKAEKGGAEVDQSLYVSAD